MKQKLLNISIWIGIVVFMVILMPDAQAHNEIPVSIKQMNGDSDLELQDTVDSIYLSAYNEIIFNQSLMNRVGNIRYQLDSLYETFIVEEIGTGDILYKKTGRDSIVFDTSLYSGSSKISFTSGGETILVDGSKSFRMYFVKAKEFSKPGTKLTLVVNVNNPLDIEELNSLFGAWDNYNGNITDSIKIIEDTYSTNMYKTGYYPVTIEAHDESNNVKQFTYIVRVKDTEPPVAEPLPDIRVSYKDVVDLNALLDLVVATDNHREELEITINEENYTGNETKVGEYYFEIMIDDFAGNAILVRQRIFVIDDVAPVISGNLKYSFKVNEAVNLETVLNSMSATDEVDKNALKVYIKNSNYVKHAIGTFEVVVGAKDIYGNEAVATVEIVVVDSIPPQFFIKIPQINILIGEHYDAEELLGLIKIQMTIDYTDIIILENDYVGNEQKPGVYQVTLSANTGTEWIGIQTQVRVNDVSPTQVEEKDINKGASWIFFCIGFTSIVGVMGVSLVIIKKRRM